MDRRNLVLTGFMGTGKTSVGRRAAQLLQREFVDMDAVIAAREGISVAEIFATRGESYFRSLERDLCAELSAQENLVIATGGGTLVDPGNRARFANATVVCLDASVDQIARRLNGARDRPLLKSLDACVPNGNAAIRDVPDEGGRQKAEAGGRMDEGGSPRSSLAPHLQRLQVQADQGSEEMNANGISPEGGRRERIEQLLASRREAYAQIEIHVDTTGRAIQEVTNQVIKSLIVHELRVRAPEGSYSIQLGRGLLDHLGAILPTEGMAVRGALVTNQTVGKLYAARVAESLRAAGFDPVVVQVPDGEEFKTLDTLRILYDRFVEAHLERRSPVWALGGGVVGDMTGFAAATFLRGVPFVQIPTTLLAMVDASLGGKVAVDHPAGKNLIGAYKFPRTVIADLDVLQTLPTEEFRSGLAELIKHAIIADAGLFEELERNPRLPSQDVTVPMMERAIRVKIELVERDPFEANVRAYLNLGHTFGHALETLSGYRLRHGYAVAIGTVVAANLAVRLGWCEATTRDRIRACFESQSLPVRVPREFTAEQVVQAMGADKKIRDGKLRLILPRALGRVDIAENVPREEIKGVIQESMGDK